MKKYLNIYAGILIVLGVLSLESCDKNFAVLNTNPNSVSSPNVGFLFTQSEYSGAGAAIPFLQGTVQYTTSYNDVAGFGAKYINGQVSQTYGAFTGAYSNGLQQIEIVIQTLKANKTFDNQLAEAQIWRAYQYSELTDLYGDVPYSQADQGFNSALYKPKYDLQQDIYADLLARLDSATTALDPSKADFAGADLLYGGKAVQWKKFGYSLMLRMAMRMTKVNITMAQTWATKAIAGGVITTDADAATMPYIGTGLDVNKNPVGNNLYTSDYQARNGTTNTEGGKYQDVWIDYLKTTHDPRINVISNIYVNTGTTDAPVYVTDTVAADQQGMSALLGVRPANFGSLSEPSLITVANPAVSMELFSGSEGNFLLCEAAFRGWSSADPSALFSTAVQEGLTKWAIIGGAFGTIPPAEINAYVNANPFHVGQTLDQAMNQIYTAFWVALFPDGQEVWNSYRRTGYPALVPNNYPGNGTNGQIPRRFEYPITEQNLNLANYNAAVAAQGTDDLLTRMWWDVAQ